MFSLQAAQNQVLGKFVRPKLYLISDTFLSRRFTFLNLGSSSKGPNTVFALVRDAACGLRIRHLVLATKDLKNMLPIDKKQTGVKYLLMNWNGNPDELTAVIKEIGSESLILGPNIEMTTKLVDFLNGNQRLYLKFLVPSAQVIQSLSHSHPGFEQLKTQIWPVGMNMKRWAPKKFHVAQEKSILIYIKGQTSESDQETIKMIQSLEHKVEIIRYGEYSSKEYLSSLRRAEAVVWFGVLESQGIAMLEAWSCNVPTFVRVDCKCANHSAIWCSSARKYSPFLKDECGQFFRHKDEVIDLIQRYLDNSNESRIPRPRAWVRMNLEARKQLLLLLE